MGYVKQQNNDIFLKIFFQYQSHKSWFFFSGLNCSQLEKTGESNLYGEKSELKSHSCNLVSNYRNATIGTRFQRGCVLSILGDFQDQVGQSPQLPMESKLTHLWAGLWTGVLLRRVLKSKLLYIYDMKIKYQYMSLKSLYIHVYISIACCFSFWFFFSSYICMHKDICPFAFFPISEGWSGLQIPELHLKYFPILHQLISYNILHFVLFSFLRKQVCLSVAQ